MLLVLLLVAMACATVFESARGTEQALTVFYHSWWFELLLALAGVNILGALLLRFPFSRRQIGFVLTHAALLVTFGGALVTKHFGVEGQVGIVEGQTVDHFAADRDMLIVENLRDQTRATVDLSGSLGGRFRPADIHDAPLVNLGELRVEVIRYLPDSEWKRRVLNDNPAIQPAVEVSLSPSGRDDPVWVLAGQTTVIGGVQASFREVADRQELDRLLGQAPTTEPASKGTVKIEYAGQTFEFPVEEGLDDPVPLGDTGCTARVRRYLPHATVGADNQVVNASDRPVNPYVEVELIGPGVSETRRAFARFPDFGAMHGAQRADGFKLTLVAAPVDAPATPVEVLSGPDGELYARFSHHAANTVTRKLEIGAAIEAPWPGRRFAVLRRYDHARVEWSLDPIEPVREQRQAGILVRLRTAEQADELWLQKHDRRSVMVGAVPHEVAYDDKSVPLGFSVMLDRFRVGFYPGGRQPRSFESHITVTNPSTGRTQSRVISMNHPASFGGYTLYQSRYRQGRGQSVSFLSVSRDPGQPVVFAGYVGVMGGMVVTLGTRMSERRRKPARSTIDD